MSRLLAMIPVLALAACSTWRPITTPIAPEVTDPELRGMLRIIGRFVIGHGCPISATEAVTNAHVTDLRPFAEWPLYGAQWSNGYGESGVLDVEAAENLRDISWIRPAEGKFSHWYPPAKDAPKAGDHVRLLSYDWRNREKAFGERTISTHVTRIVARHIILYDAGTAGSSGSCVVNDAGESVAVNAFGKELDDYKASGLAPGIWGDLLTRPVREIPVLRLFELFVPGKE